jgi:proline iminopeptidase
MANDQKEPQLFDFTLFQPVEPFQIGTLKLDEVNEMYFEQSGNPQGVPVVFLHGGPGAGSSPAHRQFFDPEFYRIIIFDQRGAGRSSPLGSLHNNTTPHLISDLELLRSHLGVQNWIVFGGSWGSTLALAYAEHYPERCLALVMRGIFLCRPSEIEWFLYGLRNIFPEAWRTFASHLPPSGRENILDAYYRLLSDPEPEVQLSAARSWSIYEGSCSTLLPSREVMASFASDRVALGLARIEAHYFKHNIFLPDNFLLENVPKIRHLPATIVQGRYDMVCPIVSADDLHRAWPEAEYRIIDAAGHSAFEPGIRSALVGAMEKLKKELG